MSKFTENLIFSQVLALICSSIFGWYRQDFWSGCLFWSGWILMDLAKITWFLWAARK